MSDYEIGILNRNVLIKVVKEQQEIINKAIEELRNVSKFVLWDESKEHLERIENILKGESNDKN